MQTSIYLFWVNFCKWNTLVPNCLHKRMCMLVSGLKIKLFFPLITLIIVSKILLCRLLGIYVYNANHFDADGNYSQVYYETTVLEFMTRIIFNFFFFFWCVTIYWETSATCTVSIMPKHGSRHFWIFWLLSGQMFGDRCIEVHTTLKCLNYYDLCPLCIV